MTQLNSEDTSRVLKGAQVAEVFARLGYARAPLEDPLTHVQGGINPFVQEVMVGLPRPVRSPGQIIYRRVGVPALVFQFSKNGKERFLHQDTRRPALAPFLWKQRGYERVTESLQRRGFVAIVDRDELANATANSPTGFVDNLAVRKAFEAREEVENDIEAEMATQLNAAGSYDTAPIVIAGGSEWDAAGGDSRSDIQNAAWTLANQNNVQPEQVGVVLTHASKEAAQSDPTMIAALTAGGGGSREKIGFTPTDEQLRGYWGVGQVDTADWFQSEPATPDTLASAYGDNAYLYLLRDAMVGFDTRETSNDFAVAFDWNRAGGVALMPVEKGVEVEGVATAILYPWESWTTPRIVNGAAAIKLENTKA